MSVVLEMISRGWDNFLARPNGPLNLRFYVQPTMAGLLALRAGIQDAREGRQGYLWAMITGPERRLQLLHEGWRGAMTPFLAAIALNSAYRLHDSAIYLSARAEFLPRPCWRSSPTPYCEDPSIASRACFCRLPGRRRYNWPIATNSLPEETCQGRTNAMSSESRRRTGRSPPRWRSPRAGTSRTRSSRGVTAPSFPRPRPATASRPGEDHSRPRRGLLRIRQDHRKDDRRAAGRACGLTIALPALGVVSHQRGNLFHVSGHFRHRLR